MKSLYRYIQNPDLLNQDTLYELRSQLARFPYDQTARLLFLYNLYLNHDSTFGEELKKASVYLADCRALFQLIEGRNYVITSHERTLTEEKKEQKGDRTLSLIDDFLNTLPKEGEVRKPTAPINPATDYVGYLLQMEDAPVEEEQPVAEPSRADLLIDNFIQNQEEGGITLPEEPEVPPQPVSAENSVEEDCLTETLAKIYIKQGRYSKALEIIQRISLNNPKKNAYFADQMRFLQKLIINNKQ